MWWCGEFVHPDADFNGNADADALH